MDGKILKPIGKAGVSGNYGRFNSPDATKALDQYANAADDATRTAALNTLQKIMVEQMPVIPTSASNVGGLYSTKNWVGWPDEQNQYGPGAADPAERSADHPQPEARRQPVIRTAAPGPTCPGAAKP